MKRTPPLFLVLIFALAINLSLAGKCLAGFSDPILGNGNAYRLSAAGGQWDKFDSAQLNFTGVGNDVQRWAEWPGAAPDMGEITLARFIALWQEGGAFHGLTLAGTLSIESGDGSGDYKVMVSGVKGDAGASTLSVRLNFGNVEPPEDIGAVSLTLKDWHGPAEENVRLTLHNKALESQWVVVFQENLAEGAGPAIVVWRSMGLCIECVHPFDLRPGFGIYAMDSHGNTTCQWTADHGDLFSYWMDYSGPHLIKAGQSSDPLLLQLENDATEESIEARLSKDGKLLAVDTLAAPGQRVSFSFDQVIYVGVADLEEGSLARPGDISSLAKIPLAGVKSADISMTGNQRDEYTFSLENIEWR